MYFLRVPGDSTPRDLCRLGWGLWHKNYNNQVERGRDSPGQKRFISPTTFPFVWGTTQDFVVVLLLTVAEQ